MQAKGHKLKDIALAAGVSHSVPSQILTGRTGVGMTVLPGISKVLGFENEGDLIVTAREWKTLNPSSDTEHMNSKGGQMAAECREAISIVRTLVDVDDADLNAAVQVFANTPVAGRRSAKWWTNVLCAEIDAIQEARRREARDERTHKRKVRASKFDS